MAFSVDSIVYTEPQTFNWTTGSFHTITTFTPQEFGTTRYDWVSWSDGGAISHSVMPTNNTTYTAQFSGTPIEPGATVSGQVFDPEGRGLRNALVTISNAQGFVRNVTTIAFGLYSFEGIPMGSSYTLRVTSKRFRFALRSVFVDGSLSGINFIGAQ